MKNEAKGFRISIYTFIGLFLVLSFVFPLVSLIINTEWSGFTKLISEDLFKESLFNSVIVSLVATIISVLLAYFCSYVINRTNIKFKKVISIVITLPMLIPSISHGLGLINLFGNNGIFTRLLGIDFNIIGFNGLIIGSILYSFPVAFLMLCDSYKYIDNTLYESASVLGLNKWQTFRKVTLCYMKKPLLSALFAVFTLIFTDYGVPIAVGGRCQTLPVYLYREVIGLLDFSKGAIIGSFLLMPAFVSFLFDLLSKDVSNDSSYSKQYVIKRNRKRDLISYAYISVIVLFLVLLFGSFIYLAFVNNYPYDNSLSLVHFKYIITNRAFRFVGNSFLISIITALVGTVFAYFSAYVTSRMKSKISTFFHIFSISSLAIPGIVLGLSYIFAFNETFIYRTFTILIMVNIVHFFASPYLMAYNALGKLNQNYEVVGLTCGVNRFRIIKDVVIPNTLQTILEMISYFFVNSMITISAVSFLFNTDTMPVSLLINQYEGQLMYEEAAIISILILCINLIFKGLVAFIKNRLNRSEVYGIK